jgi:hypothetical protein
MAGFGLSAAAGQGTDVSVGFRYGWLKHIGMVFGGGFGAAVVVGAYEILGSQPERAFGLLQSWGPAFLLAIFALYLVGRFLDGLSAMAREGISVVVGSMKSNAEAQGRTADALTRLADQGSRQFEQVERLAIYAASEFPGVYTRLDSQDKVLEGIAQSVNALRVHFSGSGVGNGGGDGSGS